MANSAEQIDKKALGSAGA